jgi:hypothetical protein
MGLGGEPDDAWADPIIREARAFTAANVVLGYDSTLKTLCVMHSNKIYPFHVPTEKWGAPIDTGITGSVQSAVTVNNRLKLTINNAGTFSLYDFHSATGTGSAWLAYSNWTDGGDALRKKTIYVCGYAFQHDNTASLPNVTIKIFRSTPTGLMDNSAGAALQKTITHVALSTSVYSPRPQRTNVRQARHFQVSMGATSAGGDSRPIKITLEGEIAETV